MKPTFRSIILWNFLWCAVTSVTGDDSTNAELSVRELTMKYGYPLEIFTNVSTEDKYLLDIFRIPHGKSNPNVNSKPVVLLMHGLLGSARDFILLGPQKGLAYLLADRNYDVWLGNARGTRYSRKHLTLDPDVDSEFWEFSWHEIGVYDLPAMFTLIRNVTKNENLSYIGLSQGTTAFYVLTSIKPEYNKNITIMISLAPVAYMAYFSSPILKLFATYEPILTPLLRLLGVYELPPKPISKLFSLVSSILCSTDGFFQEVCANGLYLIGGYDPLQLNKSIVPALLNNEPSCSARQISHYAQNINSGEFRQFSFGRRNNLNRYGSTLPPSYNITKITSPVALFFADRDLLAQPMDVDRLYRELPHCVYIYKVPYQQFSHLDFVIANDVVKLVYKNVFKLLDEYNKNVK